MWDTASYIHPMGIINKGKIHLLKAYVVVWHLNHHIKPKKYDQDIKEFDVFPYHNQSHHTYPQSDIQKPFKGYISSLILPRIFHSIVYENFKTIGLVRSPLIQFIKYHGKLFGYTCPLPPCQRSPQIDIHTDPLQQTRSKDLINVANKQSQKDKQIGKCLGSHPALNKFDQSSCLHLYSSPFHMFEVQIFELLF